MLFSINLFVSTYALIPINLFVSTYVSFSINLSVSTYVLFFILILDSNDAYVNSMRTSSKIYLVYLVGVVYNRHSVFL